MNTNADAETKKTPKDIIREMVLTNRKMEYFEGRIDQHKKSIELREKPENDHTFFTIEVPAQIIDKVDEVIMDYYMGEIAYRESVLCQYTEELKGLDKPKECAIRRPSCCLLASRR